MDKELDDLFDELEGGSVAGEVDDDETGNGTDDDETGGSDDATHDEELDGEEGKEGEATGEATGETTDGTGEVGNRHRFAAGGRHRRYHPGIPHS